MTSKDDKIDEEVEKRLDNLHEDDYDDWLDEIDGEITVGSLTFNASDIIKNCDEVAYRCGFSDYQESMRESIEDEVRDEFDEDDDKYEN
jgi:hypothetical protein